MNLGIVGIGAFAHEVYDIAALQSDRWDKIFFIGDKLAQGVSYTNETFFKDSVAENTEVLIALGEPVYREKLNQLYTGNGIPLATLIDGRAVISSHCTILPGVIIFPLCYIAHNVTIGTNTVVHASAIIENDCQIGSNCFISLNSFTGSKSSVSDNCFIGPNAALRDKITVGANTIVGMGSVVTGNCDEKSVYVGNPAKKIRENSNRTVFK